MKIMDEIERAYRDYIEKMHGVAPNRLLLTERDGERFQAACEPLAPFVNRNYTEPVKTTIYKGMRLVIDENADGVEVAYAR